VQHRAQQGFSWHALCGIFQRLKILFLGFLLMDEDEPSDGGLALAGNALNIKGGYSSSVKTPQSGGQSAPLRFEYFN